MNKKISTKIVIVIIVLIAGGFLLSKIFESKKEKNESVEVEIEQTVAEISDENKSNDISREDNASDDEIKKSNIKEFEIIVKQWSFAPSLIKLKKGDKVKLKIRSVDVPHGFAMPVGYKIDKRVDPGEIVEVEFTANEVGEFPFFCSIGCGDGHFEMEGKIIVSE